jgi:hypothetical protein
VKPHRIEEKDRAHRRNFCKEDDAQLHKIAEMQNIIAPYNAGSRAKSPDIRMGDSIQSHT